MVKIYVVFITKRLQIIGLITIEHGFSKNCLLNATETSTAEVKEISALHRRSEHQRTVLNIAQANNTKYTTRVGVRILGINNYFTTSVHDKFYS